MEILDHTTINTLVGTYNADENEFTTLDNNKYRFICYRPVREAITNKLAIVNVHYDYDVQCFVAFQYMLIQKEEVSCFSEEVIPPLLKTGDHVVQVSVESE
jgi:hypothetical protein